MFFDIPDCTMIPLKVIGFKGLQLLAGHKWISSTAPYRQTSIDKQKDLGNRFHPLGN